MVFGMFTFSCFNPHVLSRRTKKTVETSAEAMEKNSELSASSKLGLKSEDIKPKASFKHDIDVRHRMNLKKSLSLGSELYMAARTSVDNDTDEGGHMFSSDFPNESIEDALKRQPSLRGEGSESKGSAFRSNHRSVFLAEDPSHSEKVSPQLSDSSLSDGQVENSGNRSWNFSSGILRSSSLPNIIESSPALASRNTLVQARSSDDLRALETRKVEHMVHKVGPQPTKQEETVKDLHKSENDKVESFSIPLTDEGEPGKPVHKELLLPNSDFKTKRIEAWVSELQHYSEQDEAFESSDHHDEVQPDLKAAKEKETLTPGMVAVRKYVSLLSLSATTAQLVNQGLTVIPFLSAFPSLRVLNLTGNSIVRITAGALPRGLHELNLSKNNISTIEGLRELTRLRKLDLRYNRILRIGHGLASCSSLKELYLDGNRISEVEGLHRLLKLSVLDLRFNKISTAKSLGQLAANYNSLQAISLEGNPAQKNVGDEQLKKYLQGLLPKLAYLNSIPIKTSSLKDTADRSVRLAIGANRLDRSLRSELKSTRRSGHGVKQELKRPVAGSKGRSARPPVAGVPAMAHGQQHYLDVFGNRVLNFGSPLSIRRSRSAGTLASLPVS